MKLWQKDNKSSSELIEKFTVGNDKELDLVLAEFDVKGSIAHTQMLESIGLLTKDELQLIHAELHLILNEIKLQNFKIEDGIEDIHSQIELMLTKRIGETGKKIHSGRSRNDQVLTDIKLYLRLELKEIVQLVEVLFKQLIALSETHKNKLLPGYTHLQIAMPSSFGLWFGAYAESLVDDMELVIAAYNVTNKNPLGSGAGYGSSFPLNREMTTKLLEFETMNYNVVYAQMSRGKTEKIVAMAMSSIAATLSKLAYDSCLYMNQNFGFIAFPDELTTGSSIMPHKKNPDVFELIRAKCNKIQALPNELTLITNNLPSGYHRDMQLTKESLFPAIKELKSCLEMTAFMLDHIIVKEMILQDEKYTYLFSVEAVNEQVLAGISFRDAYKNVGNDIENNCFNPSTNLNHTHAGSIGNLCNDQIVQQMETLVRKIKTKLQ
ncbi:MAG: argininosuccinate lyase [Flavobacteriaceae bacterium]|jgi:argininosuccinate lyase|nr:argininosuccinate lyase [Flavobacteriaceae bacterium]